MAMPIIIKQLHKEFLAMSGAFYFFRSLLCCTAVLSSLFTWVIPDRPLSLGRTIYRPRAQFGSVGNQSRQRLGELVLFCMHTLPHVSTCVKKVILFGLVEFWLNYVKRSSDKSVAWVYCLRSLRYVDMRLMQPKGTLQPCSPAFDNRSVSSLSTCIPLHCQTSYM